MIIVDYSGISISSITGFVQEYPESDAELLNICRHVLLTSIRSYKKKFQKTFGSQLVIACDTDTNWRREVFPNYKFKRSGARAASAIPFHRIYACMDTVREELREHFPYKVLQVPRAEADDVMAIIAREALVTSNLFDQEQDTSIVISDDHDMYQLVNANIKVWGPRHKKYAIQDHTPAEYLKRHILTGDSGDGIPNVFSSIDSFFNGVRQLPATEKKMAPMLQAETLEAGAPSDEVVARIKMNRQLISFDHVPADVRAAIHAAHAVPANGTQMSVFKYLAKNKMSLLLKEAEQF